MNIDYISEKWISQNRNNLTKLLSNIEWNLISRKIELSENLIQEFQDQVNWDNISFYQKLSENFIRKFQDKINWKYISYRQKLSEDFIIEFQDKINWKLISEFQILSEKFILKFKDKIVLCFILKKYGYNVYIRSFKNCIENSNGICIKSNNYCSDYLEYSEFVDLAIKLIKLKAFS